MPLPEISSHVGARRSDFVEILDCIRTLLSTLCCIETIHVQAGRELDNIDIGTLVYIMASASSTLADLSNALNLVRTSQCCKGPQISWKPKAPEYWEELENMVSTLANSASDAITGINMSLSSRGRDAMLLLMNLESLIHDMKQCEVSISRALDVSKPTQPVSETIKNKNLKEKLIHNAYIPSLLVHTALLSGGAVYMLVILSLVKLFKGTKAFFRSAEERLESASIYPYLYNIHSFFTLSYAFCCSYKGSTCAVRFQVLDGLVIDNHVNCFDSLEDEIFLRESTSKCV